MRSNSRQSVAWLAASGVTLCMLLGLLSWRGAFPAALTLGSRVVVTEMDEGQVREQTVLSEGTPHGRTTIYERLPNGQRIKVSQIEFQQGVAIELLRYHANGQLQYRAYEPVVGGPVVRESYDEMGRLIRRD